MKKVLLFLLLIVPILGATYIHAKAVKQVNGVKVPGSLDADYDDLEDKTVIDYPVYAQFSGLAGKFVVLSASLVYNNSLKKVEPNVLLSLQTIEGRPLPMYKMEAFMDASSAVIFIKNPGGTKKYIHVFKDKLISKNVQGGSTEIVKGVSSSYQNVIVREHETIQAPEIIQFLADNLEEKSEVIIRFINDTSGAQITQELSKGEVKKLFDVFDLYKKLK